MAAEGSHAYQRREAGIRDVAAAAGVSIATVSRALNGLDRVSAETSERVQHAADQLGYLPNDLARALHRKTTRTLGLVVPDITNPFFPELAQGVQRRAAETDVLVLLVAGVETADDLSGAVQALTRRRVDGIVLVGSDLAEAVNLRVGNVPIVAVDRADGMSAWASVESDQRNGSYLATKHLLALGHRRIAFVGGPSGLAVATRRQEGFAQALEEAGLDLPHELCVAGPFTERAGYDCVMELLARRHKFTAVVAASDVIAIGAVRALRDVGLECPGDVSVVGFDDITVARYVSPALTTVRQPIEQLGRLAADIALQAVRGAPDHIVEHHVLDVELIVRDSTSRVHHAP